MEQRPRYSLRWREGKKWIRSISTFRSLKSAREHVIIIGASDYIIRRLARRKKGGSKP